MTRDVHQLSRIYFETEFDDLTERDRHVLEKISRGQRIARNVNKLSESHSTYGGQLADKVAQFGGSWTFIILFIVVLMGWIGVNTYIVQLHRSALDPYPFIFLNLILSMLAALQAPVIMMSQNRQASKDRLDASNDYDVNLKAELEIMQLHEKMDDVRQNQLKALFTQQEQQLEMIERLLEKRS